ncbi:MAG: capsule biosynthesis protein [Nitrospira sp.]|nr:capsule biosynthesis protein [Nitrospira sp.]
MKVLFFAPHSALWVHAFPEALVAESLQQCGHEVIYVGCGKALQSYCVPMAAHGLRWDSEGPLKAEVCNTCDRYKSIIRSRFDFKGHDLSSFITEEDNKVAESFVSSATRDNLLTLNFERLEVGRYALYSLLIKKKKSQLKFSDQEWDEYRTSLHTTVLAAIGGRRILDKEKPDILVVYNSLYSVNRVCVELAKASGIVPYFLHAGGNFSNRLQTLILARDDWFAFTQRQIEYWREHSESPCGADELASVTDHFAELFQGRSAFVYSAAPSRDYVDVRSFFGIGQGQRILLATMSSYDELFAAQLIRVMPECQGILFPQQVDWIKAVSEFVSERPDLFLIIRVHPREFPNKREGEKSEHASAMEEVFRELPPNVRVNWPADSLSLYDLAEEADVVLNAWSSAGKEMGLFGLPVVSYAPQLLAYPPELNYIGETVNAYFACIDQALHDGWSMENIRKGYRWHSLELKSSLIDISDSYSHSESKRPGSTLQGAFHAVGRRLVSSFDQHRDCARRARHLASAELINRVVMSRAPSVLTFHADQQRQTVTLAEETVILRTELRRLVRARYGRETTTTSHRRTLKKRLIECSTAD